MADYDRVQNESLPSGMKTKYKDMGDGTHAIVVATTLAAGAVNIGDVDVATIAAGDNNIGNVDVASIAAGDNNIGNVDVASIAAGANTIGATRDAGPSWTSSYTHTASADATGAVDLTAAPTSGQKIVVDDIIFATDTAMNFIFEEETSGTDIIKIFCGANSTVQLTPRGQIKLPTADKKLRGDASVSGNIAVTVVYHSEPA